MTSFNTFQLLTFDAFEPTPIVVFVHRQLTRHIDVSRLGSLGRSDRPSYVVNNTYEGQEVLFSPSCGLVIAESGLNKTKKPLTLGQKHNVFKINRSYRNLIRMSKVFEIRKVQAMGTRGVDCIHTHIGPHSFASVIPQTYVQQIGLKKGDFLKFQIEGNRIWMEKLQEPGTSA